MKIQFIGATHEVTGSCTLLEVCGKKYLIDCGMEQGIDVFENVAIPVPAEEIEAVFLTHAHIDHSGMLPKLYKDGFRGSIFATATTCDLCNIMLRDSAHIQESEAQWRNRKAERAGDPLIEPVYTMTDAIGVISKFRPCAYNDAIQAAEGIVVRFSDIGHLLGSAAIELWLTENKTTKKIVFSGDVGNINQPLINDPLPVEEAEYLVIESTYGDRLHAQRPDYVAELTDIIQSTFDKGGNVVIPSFAVGRTQELLYLIRTIKERNLIRGHGDFPVYVDSPLAVEATKIYSMGMTEYYDEETLELLSRGIDPIRFPELRLAITSADSKLINEDKEPKVILSASGMCEAGRIRHHLKHNLWRENSTILFVGYQAEGTIGRKLLDGASTVKLFGEEIAVHARIAAMQGISGHADRDMMLNWLAGMPEKPKMVFVNHGNDQVTDSFAQTIAQKFGVEALAPYSGDEYDLATGECTAKGIVTRVTKLTPGRQRSNAIFDRLLAAGKRLLRIIEASRGLSNKELARFADKVDALCDKYEGK